MPKALRLRKDGTPKRFSLDVKQAAMFPTANGAWIGTREHEYALSMERERQAALLSRERREELRRAVQRLDPALARRLLATINELYRAAGSHTDVGRLAIEAHTMASELLSVYTKP